MSLLCHFLDSGQGKVVQGGVVKVDDLRLSEGVVDNISPEAKRDLVTISRCFKIALAISILT